MRLDIHTTRIDVTDSIRDYIERRADFAFDRFDHVVDDISVNLEDTNGPRGGVDQQCRIRLKLAGERSPVMSSAVHEEIKAAIDQAFETASRTIARILDRRTRSKQQGPKAVAPA